MQEPRIKKLEKIAQQLDPNQTDRKALLQTVSSTIENFLSNLPEAKTYSTNKNTSKTNQLQVTSNGEPLETLLTQFKTEVEDTGINAASGGHLGYIPGGGLYAAALADYIAATTNRYAGVYFASPGAVAMENSLIEFMAATVGYGPDAAGNLTSGGSYASLISIITARDAMKIKAAEFHRLVVYKTKQTHHALLKSIKAAGLRECIVRDIAVDEQYKMRSEALAASVEEDKHNGLLPFMIIGSAGTTDVGAIDPLDALAEIANKHGVWFHVDAAYGGAFMLVEEMKTLFKGIEKSDSVVLDPHKGLFLPFGSGMVLVKNKNKLLESNAYDASYMEDAIHHNDALSPADLSPELSKHFRGLRMWLPLKLHGIEPFQACLEEKILLAQYFYNCIANKVQFEVEFPPQLSVVHYRYLPLKGDANAFNKNLVKRIQDEGSFFISYTTLNDKVFIRLAVLSFRTHLKDIKSFLLLLFKIIKELDS